MVIVKTHLGPPLSNEVLKQRLIHWASTAPRYPFFEGSSKDLPIWFSNVEEACRENAIPEFQCTDAALMLISGDLKYVMEERKQRYLEKSAQSVWEWRDFQDDLKRVVAEGERILAESSKPGTAKDAMAQFRRNHPHIVASAGVGLMIGGSLVILPALGILALNAIGFTAGGVAAGSFAAALQSMFWGGATGGLFSVLQSIGATAVLPAVSAIVGASTAVGTGAVSVAYANAAAKDHERPPSPVISNSAHTESDCHSNVPPPPYRSLDEGAKVQAPYAVYTSRRYRGDPK